MTFETAAPKLLSPLRSKKSVRLAPCAHRLPPCSADTHEARTQGSENGRADSRTAGAANQTRRKGKAATGVGKLPGRGHPPGNGRGATNSTKPRQAKSHATARNEQGKKRNPPRFVPSQQALHPNSKGKARLEPASKATESITHAWKQKQSTYAPDLSRGEERGGAAADAARYPSSPAGLRTGGESGARRKSGRGEEGVAGEACINGEAGCERGQRIGNGNEAKGYRGPGRIWKGRQGRRGAHVTDRPNKSVRDLPLSLSLTAAAVLPASANEATSREGRVTWKKEVNGVFLGFFLLKLAFF